MDDLFRFVLKLVAALALVWALAGVTYLGWHRIRNRRMLRRIIAEENTRYAGIKPELALPQVFGFSARILATWLVLVALSSFCIWGLFF